MDKIDRLVKFIREEGAIVNNVGDGKIAGKSQAGDDPPVNKKKDKRKQVIGMWSRTLRGQ